MGQGLLRGFPLTGWSIQMGEAGQVGAVEPHDTGIRIVEGAARILEFLVGVARTAERPPMSRPR